MTRVVNIRVEPYNVYIGRPSKWGNPFIIGRDGPCKRAGGKVSWSPTLSGLLVCDENITTGQERARGDDRAVFSRANGEWASSPLHGGEPDTSPARSYRKARKMMQKYEYGVTTYMGTHRDGMTEREARAWLADLEEDDPQLTGVFRLIRRSLGEWETVIDKHPAQMTNA